MAADAGPAERETLARDVLGEFTRAGEVGPLIDETSEDGVWTLHFAATSPGYPGWRWTVSLAQLEDADPTVLEAELLPSDGALLAPDWVPWSTRLEEWRAQQAASGAVDADASGDAEAVDAEARDRTDQDDDLADDELDDDDEPDEDDDDLGDDVYDGLDPEAALGEDDDDGEHDEGEHDDD